MTQEHDHEVVIEEEQEVDMDQGNTEVVADQASADTQPSEEEIAQNEAQRKYIAISNYFRYISQEQFEELKALANDQEAFRDHIGQMSVKLGYNHLAQTWVSPEVDLFEILPFEVVTDAAKFEEFFTTRANAGLGYEEVLQHQFDKETKTSVTNVMYRSTVVTVDGHEVKIMSRDKREFLINIFASAYNNSLVPFTNFRRMAIERIEYASQVTWEEVHAVLVKEKATAEDYELDHAPENEDIVEVEQDGVHVEMSPAISEVPEDFVAGILPIVPEHISKVDRTVSVYGVNRQVYFDANLDAEVYYDEDLNQVLL